MFGRYMAVWLRGFLFLGGWGAGLWLYAAEAPVELVLATRHVPERGSLPAGALVKGKERDSFIVPAGWRMGLEHQSGVVLLQSAEYAGQMEIRRLPLPEKGVNFDALRDEVSSPETRREVSENYAWVGSPNRSQVFDSFETVGNNLKLRRRICFMVREDHVLVIALRAQAERFAACLRAYEIVLASLRQE